MGKRLDNLKQLILGYKRIIIYGAGTNAHPILSWLQESEEFSDIKINIAVTKPKINEEFRGYKVYKIDELVLEKNSALVIVAVFKDYEKDIDGNLLELGFTNIVHIEEWFVDEAFYEPIKNEPINEKKVLVENFHGLGYGDSPKYIVDELIRQRNDLDIVWIVKQGIECDFPEGVRAVRIYSKQFYYEVYTAKVWISNVRKYQSVKKRIGQFYIQTWHGFPLKKIEKDAEEISNGISAPYFDAGKKDSEMIDVLLSNASFLTRIFKKTFWYNGKIIECGTPRNDIFFKNDISITHKLKKYFNLTENKKIILYAPTFRNNYKENPIDVDMDSVVSMCEKKFGGEWVGLVRMHPNIAKKETLFTYTDKVINATWYPDIMELLYSSDVVITDYSSVMFDFMITKRPVFLYAKDRDRYVNADRGFYFEYDSLPFSISATKAQLVSSIENYDEEIYRDKLSKFMRHIGFCDRGTASLKTIEMINEVI